MIKVEDIITNDEKSIMHEKSTKVVLEETITTAAADISITCTTAHDNIKDEECNTTAEEEEEKSPSNVAALQLSSNFNFDDENAVQFALQ